jgi:hypothetical protein
MEFGLRMRERFIRQSASCGREIEVISQLGCTAEHPNHPQGACGSENKKAHANPALREISKAEAVVCFGYSLAVKMLAKKG